MGDSYVVIPFDPRGEVADWLRQEKVRFPASLKKSRWPTMRELVAVLKGIQGARVKRRKSGAERWDLEVVREAGSELERADLWVKNVADLDTPVGFHFHKPSPDLALNIVERLTHICGPLVFMAVGAMVPVLVRPGADLVRVARRLLSA